MMSAWARFACINLCRMHHILIKLGVEQVNIYLVSCTLKLFDCYTCVININHLIQMSIISSIKYSFYIVTILFITSSMQLFYHVYVNTVFK